MKKEAKLSVSSYSFLDLDDSKIFHIESETLNLADRTIMYSPHRINHYVIRWIKQGSGNVTIDHINYPIKPDVLFLGHPDQVRWFDVDEQENFETVFVAFTKEALALLNLKEGIESQIGMISKVPIIELSGSIKKIVEDTFSQLLNINQLASPSKFKMMAASIQILLLAAADYNLTQHEKLPIRKQSYLNLYRSFLDSLNEHYKKYHFASDYSDLMLIPLKRLNRACKYATGKTPSEIVSDRLDFEAKRYLYYSSNTIKEISYELGYSDPTYFMKSFKSKNGISANQFRQHLSKFT